MFDLNWLEFAGVCGIGTVAFLLFFLIIEISKEVLSKSLESEDKKEEKD